MSRFSLMPSVRFFAMPIITLEEAFRSMNVADVLCAPGTRFYAQSTDFVIVTKLDSDQGGGIGPVPFGCGLVSMRALAMRSCLLLFALFLLPAPALAGAKEKVAALAPSGMVFVVDADGKELVAQNADKPFVPASVTKIVTAWLAMEVLGPDYRFETRFYLDGNRVLYIRGGGDPFLVSEELALLAPPLVAAIGKQPLSGIVLDASYYPSDIRIPGIENPEEAYDALNSALAVNFNTI